MADELSGVRSMLVMGDRAGANRELRRLMRDNASIGKGEGWWILADLVDDEAQAKECRERAVRAGYKAPPGAVPAETNLLDRIATTERPVRPPAPPAPPPQAFTGAPTPPYSVPDYQCPRCGARNPGTTRFCGGCGLDMAAPAGPPVGFVPMAGYPMPKRNAPIAGGVLIAGAVLVMLGSMLPWVTVSAGVFSRSVNGFDGDGKFTLAGGVALLFVGIAFLIRKNVALRVLGWIFTVLTGLIVGYDALNINAEIVRQSSVDAALGLDSSVTSAFGAGMYVLAVGLLLAGCGSSLETE